MAEVKNSFLQSKMNKDLDDRLIPNGQYRDALNVSVGKVEDEDVGSLESILGNEQMVNTGNSNLICIGQVTDNQNNRIFQFWTDYRDLTPGVMNPAASGDMRITMYDATSGTGVLTTLVSGVFLNFASNNAFRIIGANVLEDLLFWTDNRNQPRKINITKALSNPNYYTSEVQISVAKYSPVLAPSLYLDISVVTNSTSTNPTPETLSFTVSNSDALKLHVGMQLIYGVSLDLDQYAVITNIDISTVSPFNGTITVSIPSSFTATITSGTTLNFFGTSMTDEADNPLWPGDPNYLKDKYIRMSYRYKFDDGEYSLMAPFTQILFIPNQNGYFLSGDENAAYRSTVVSWMENYINNIVLHISLPDIGNNVANSYKISNIEILYKESDSTTIKALETVSLNEIQLIAGDTNLFTYTYRSQQPYKTLPEAQTVRVYDKVPIRARSQEIVGNRVVYGNYISQNTPPASIDYNLSITRKTDIFESWAEYPNHTLKQNRNYQVGIILADKFGRQSSVILSSNDALVTSGSLVFKGSTIYSPYIPESLATPVKEWRGNTLAMIINSPITSVRNEGAGTPGLYATISGVNGQTNQGFEITASTITTTGNNSSCTYTLASSTTAQLNYPINGTYVRGKYTDYVKVKNAVSGYFETEGVINDYYLYNGNSPDVKYSYDLNQLGWYSYKVVVRQQQQEYYNVYLPGILNGYPMFQTSGPAGINTDIFPTNETNKTAHTVLLNDNINKVPRDLLEVGPDQRQYRSSVEVFGRVENTLINEITSNKQYYPSRKADVVSTIGTSNELNFLALNDPDNLKGTASNNFYQLNTTPSIARISTVDRIGVIASDLTVGTNPPYIKNTMNPFLSVYETAPTVSLLDLFWETSTSGLISDLNQDVLTGSDLIVGFDNLQFNIFEWQNPAGLNYTNIDLNPGTQQSPFVTDYFQPIDSTGIPVAVTSMVLTVQDLGGNNRSLDFYLYKETTGINTGKYAIKITNNSPFVFLTTASTVETYQFTFDIIDINNNQVQIVANGALQNSTPIINIPTVGQSLLLSNTIPGVILFCAGTNGANSASVNTQQLQWSITSASTTGWETFFSIDQISGQLSLINPSFPPNIAFSLVIRATDVYNFNINSTGAGSLYSETTLLVTYVTEDILFCSDWTSVISPPNPTFYENYISGFFNFWRLLTVGETIDISNSNVYITKYTTFPEQTTEYPVNQIEGKINFIPGSFQGDFAFTKTISGNEPAYKIFFSGQIRTSSGRVINVNDFTMADWVDEGWRSAALSCGPYIGGENVSFEIVNPLPDTPISWAALSAPDLSQIIGSTIPPGYTGVVGSVGFGGTYGCITVDSLKYTPGAITYFQVCI